MLWEQKEHVSACKVTTCETAGSCSQVCLLHAQEFLYWLIQRSLEQGLEACQQGLWEPCIILVQAAARLLAAARCRDDGSATQQACILVDILVCSTPEQGRASVFHQGDPHLAVTW